MATWSSAARAISAIPDTAWTPVRYPGAVPDPDTGAWISDAEVAEVPQFCPGTLPGTDGPSGSTNQRSVGGIRPLDPRLSVIALWSLSETRCLRHPPPTTGRPAYVLITCHLRAPYGPSGRGSAP